MKKYISFSAILLFIIPSITIFICHQIVAHYYDFHTIPFIDGKASVSMIGRGEKTIGVFRLGFFLYILISIFFYSEISNYLSKKKIKNKFKIYGISANFFLFIYIVTLGQDEKIYEICRRLAIIFYIANIYLNHIFLFKIIKLLKSSKQINFNNIYIPIFYTILILMTVLVIIGTPWVNPLFKYPDQLKNIIEWNFFLLTIIFYIPVTIIFYRAVKD